MPPALTNILEKIDNRVLRERVLIFLTLLAVIFLLWNFLVQSTFDRERNALQADATKIANEQKTRARFDARIYRGRFSARRPRKIMLRAEQDSAEFFSGEHLR